MTAILTHPAAYVLAWSLAWGLLSDLFGSDRGPERVQPAAVQTAMERIASLGQHEATRATYAAGGWAPLWDAGERRALAGRLREAPADGLDPETIGADRAETALARMDRARARWASLDEDARDSLPDPRAEAIARADLYLTDALFRLADGLVVAS